MPPRPTDSNKPSRFWQELKRRRVVHVIIVYATSAFVILEAVDIIFPRLNFPDWTITFVMILLAVGFPIALIFSWIFEISSKGIKKTGPIEPITEGKVVSSMSDKSFNLWQELKRRKVVRVITVYAAAAFVILELTDIVAPSLGLPDWTLNFIIILLCVGFIITVIVSWIYDIHPEGGIVKTEPVIKVPEESFPPSFKGWKIASYISFVVIVGLILLNIIPRNIRSGEFSDIEKSIAVLPFENMSDDTEYSFIGDAMTAEIIMQLYKINSFKVRPRTSVMHYKNSGKDNPLIGEELNVNYLLTGSTQRNSNQIWGDEFDRDWKDVIDIQKEIAKQVAKELKIVLSPDEVETIEKNSTENIEAYNKYLQGNNYFHRGNDKRDLNIAINLFKEAI